MYYITQKLKSVTVFPWHRVFRASDQPNSLYFVIAWLE